MRILLVTNLLPPAADGGYEAECAAVLGRLRERHEVTVLTSWHRRRAVAAVVREPDVRRVLPLLRPHPLATALAPVAAGPAAAVTRRVVRSVRPDLVWVWNGAALPHAALRVLETAGVPLALRVSQAWWADLHTADPFTRALVPGHVVPGGAVHRAHAATARVMNRAVPGLRLSLAGEPVPVAVAWNSEALRRDTPPPPTERPVLERVIHPASPQAAELAAAVVRRPDAEQPMIAFVGRLEVAKGPDLAVRALARLRDAAAADARLVLAGPGSPARRAELGALARSLGVADAVELPGAVTTGPLAELLGEASVVVVPSIGHEGFGLVAVEAAAAGVPVVAARNGGLVEALREDRGEARFFAVGDDAGCAAALAATLRDEAGTAAQVERARARAAELTLPRFLDAMETFAVEAREVPAGGPPGRRAT